MKKLLLALGLILIVGITPCYSANQWLNGSGEDTPLGTESVSDIDAVLFQRVVDPLDRNLSHFRHGALITRTSDTTLSVSAGSITCENSASTVRRMRQNTSATSVGWSDLDTGSEASSATYSVYGVCDADATTFTVKISASSTAPTGVTYYKKLGTFYNNSSSNISRVENYDDYEYSDPSASDTSEGTSYSTGTAYQNTTGHKLMVVWYGRGCRAGGWGNINQQAYIGETSSPATKVAGISFEVSADPYYTASASFVVPEGWYWQIDNETGLENSVNCSGTVTRIEAFEFD